MFTPVPTTPIGVLSDAWRACVGTGRLNLALRSDYRDSLERVQREIGFRHLRGHGLLSDDLGIHRPYEFEGVRRVRHAFGYLDQVVDSWLELGIRPFLELGFMPSGLASGEQTVFWWKGNVTPPADEEEWAALVVAVVRHLIDRHGIDEVRSWPIEVWNEPNLVHFWKDADQAAYFRLYERTARALKDLDASLQLGGPAISPGSDEWWAPFAEFVTSREVPIDFVSRHAYSSGPSQRVPFGVYQTLAEPQTLLDQFAAPRRHLAGTGLERLPVHITEFNTSYRPDNPVHDTAYNAAYLAPVLAGGGDLVDSFSYWTFCDVFEEENIPTSPFHGGFGLLGHRQLAKPTFHLYAFMARLGAEVLARGADHLVTRHPDGRLAVLAWQPVDGTSAGAERHTVRLALPVGGPAVYAHRHRVNEDDGNAWTAWQQLGRPHHPTARQLDLLHEASRPALEHGVLPAGGGVVELELHLARHEICLVELEGVRDETEPWIDDDRVPGYAGGWRA
ncbi:GH39 family glycosyl hydrolase [Protaetiibacter larvae]|uniref:Xylan 1,4-beta-xylosidase n=1 Tax=Protaetiibacter larvae TaxID=2592654 RepID=A0A5C1Y4K5_9MICO|nr:xylan 1,4-beta-xylosidase [Protaetiibacter larvae]QEO08963.1 xylan 1,4-beta-xylosidase [Protaetiibacter larvae]